MRFVTFGDVKTTVTLPVKSIRQIGYYEIKTNKEIDEYEYRINVTHKHGTTSFHFQGADAEDEASRMWIDIHNQIKVRK